MSNKTPEPYIHTLYLVFHGEFAICHRRADNGNPIGIWVLAPKVNGHVYEAGPYPKGKAIVPNPNGEPPLLESSGHVQGGSCACLPPLLYVGPKVEPRCKKAQFTLRLPLPRKVWPGLLEETANLVIRYKNNRNIPQRPKTTLIPILEYECDGKGLPYLKCGRKRWFAGRSKVKGYAAIHVCASMTTGPEPPMHAQGAFSKAAQLLDVQGAKITWESGAKFKLETVEPPDGLLWNEINLTLPMQNDQRIRSEDLEKSGKGLRYIVPDDVSTGNCAAIDGGPGLP